MTNKYITRMVSFDEVCYLLGDAETMIFCAQQPVNSSERFTAAQQNIKAEVVLLTDKGNYHGETKARFHDKVYRIYKTYVTREGNIELCLAFRSGVSG